MGKGRERERIGEKIMNRENERLKKYEEKRRKKSEGEKGKIEKKRIARR